MDPVTACGLTSNVLHLVEVSWKVVSTGHQIYQNGALPENRSTEEVTLDLQLVNSRLLEFLEQVGHERDLSEDDKALHALCQSCNTIATQLVTRLNLIQFNKGHRSWKSVRQALKSVWMKGELDEIAARLQVYRTQLNTRIIYSVRERLDVVRADSSCRFRDLHQALENIEQSLVENRRHLDTSQEIQTHFLTRLVTSQNEQTRKLLTSATDVSKKRGFLSELPAFEHEHVVSTKSQSTQAVFEAVRSESVASLRTILRNYPSSISALDICGKTPLHIAVTTGNSEIVEYLIRNGAKLCPDDNNGQTPLHCAVVAGYERVVRTLVAKGADLQAKNTDGRTPKDYADLSTLLGWILTHGAHLEARNGKELTALYYFAMRGDIEAVRSLLGQGADISTKGRWNRTPLMEACDQGHLEIVEILITSGANIESTDYRDGTPIILAGWKGHVRVAERLLDHGANINAQNCYGYTALAEACRHGNGEMTLMLLRRGAETETLNDEGNVPLYQAVVGGHTAIVGHLLDHGANIDAKSGSSKCTALGQACYDANLELVDLLLSRGACVETRDGKLYCTPLIQAAKEGRTSLVIRLLDQGKANIEGVDREGLPALFYAVFMGHADTVQALLNRRANTEARDHYRCTPLGSASLFGRLSIVKSLLEVKADIEAFNLKGQTPLAEAINHLDIVNVLLNHGANVNTRDTKRQTPLHRAAREGRLSIVIALLGTGKADVNVIDAEGWTPLARASWAGYINVVKALLENGAKPITRTKSREGPYELAIERGHGAIVAELQRYICIDDGQRSQIA